MNVVITGVTRGLGLSLVEEFIQKGVQVAGCGRSKPVIRQLNNRFPDHLFHEVDVSSYKEVEQWGEQVHHSMGSPQLLINNAALINKNAYLWEVPPKIFSQVIDVNIKGVFHIICAFLPNMILEKSSVIVNFSSGWGRSTAPEVAPYCTTKWAVEGLTQALAQELPVGMAAVSFNPGIINTAMLQSSFGSAAGMYESPDDWAKRAAPFLLSLGSKHNGKALSL